MSYYIGDIEIKNKVVLAPLAGVSNPTYMKICEDFGVGYAVTELISAEALTRENKKTMAMLDGLDKLNIPYAIQLFGANPEVMAAAARIVNQKYPKAIIDINMGCPVPKIALKSGAGSALLKNPDKIYAIVASVVSAVDVPVTVKIRSGWDAESINAVEVAQAAFKAGAKAIAIHARTRAQGYSGAADLEIIKAVVESVDIPVIGNGDIKTVYDAEAMLQKTGCAAVMIGRALMGNPWLIRDTVNYLYKNEKPKEVTIDEKIDMMEYHLDQLVKDKGESSAVLEMRGHLLNYLAGLPNNKEVKNKVCSARHQQEIIDILEDYRINNG